MIERYAVESTGAHRLVRSFTGLLGKHERDDTEGALHLTERVVFDFLGIHEP